MIDSLELVATYCMYVFPPLSVLVPEVGAPPAPVEIKRMSILSPRPIITGSVIGGMKETQDRTSDIELIRATSEILKRGSIEIVVECRK